MDFEVRFKNRDHASGPNVKWKTAAGGHAAKYRSAIHSRTEQPKDLNWFTVRGLWGPLEVQSSHKCNDGTLYLKVKPIQGF